MADASISGPGARLEMLIRTGLLRPPRAPLPAEFLNRAGPLDPEGKSLSALLEARASGL